MSSRAPSCPFLTALLVALAALPAVAQEKDGGTGPIVPPVGSWTALDALARGGAWPAFEARFGAGWSIHNDPITGSPSILVGPGIDVGTPVQADEAGIALARAWMVQLAGLFGVDDPSAFVLERAVAVENPWNHQIVTINFKQTAGGMDVWHQLRGGLREHLAMVKFQFDGTLGRMVQLGSDAVSGLSLTATAAPFGEEEARSAALQSVLAEGLVPGKTAVRSYVSVRPEGRFIVREAEVVTDEPTPHDWKFMFNAETGLLIERRDDLRHVNVVGNVSAGTLDFPLLPAPGGTFSVKPMRSLRVTVTGGGNAVTDVFGNFDIVHAGTTPVTITGRFSGDWSVVNDMSGNGNLSFSTAATPGTPAAVVLNPADVQFETAEATAYHEATKTRWFIRKRINTFNGLPALPTNVNVNASCNATWNGSAINFYRAASGCNNTAYAEVVNHEYGHGFHFWFHGSTSPGGFSEAIGDHMGLYMTQQRVIGRNFRTNGTVVRDYRTGGPSNNRQLGDPACGGQVHCLGEAWAGTMADLWDNIRLTRGAQPGADIAERITVAQYASNPANETAAMANIFTQDDNNGNLADGTPNCADIRAAATRHSVPVPGALPANCGTGPAPTTLTLSNQPGNGRLSVTTDGYGSYGSSVGGGTSNLMYDDLGGAGSLGTTFQSAVLFASPTLAFSQWLSTSSGFSGPGMPPIAITGNISNWNFMGIQFQLTQVVAPGGDSDGTAIQQTYSLTNNTGAPQELQMVRYADTDLFGSSLGDAVGASVSTGTTTNDHWVFSYKTTGAQTCNDPRPACAITAEGRDSGGVKVVPCGFRGDAFATLRSALSSGVNPCAALNRTLLNDGNADRLVCPAEATYDATLAIGVRFLNVPTGATVRFHTRTRLTERSPARARDIVPESRAGNVNQTAFAALFVNGSAAPCQVGPPTINIGVRASPGGPAPTHYLIYAIVGKPNTGELCGGPLAMDAADWRLPSLIPNLGTAVFSLTPHIFTGRGGASNGGSAALVSSVPGAALLPGPVAGAGVTNVLALPALGFSITLQGALLDSGSANGSLSLTNAIQVAPSGCACQP